MRRIRNLLILIALTILASQAAGRASAQMPFQIPLNQALVLEGGESNNPREYDPATTHGSGDKLVYSGLVAFDPRLNLIPDLAENWQISPDGMTYVFTLRKTARFHNGRTLTAQDIVYSWERAADPRTQSDTVVTYLGDIVGVKEMHSAQADHISGLKALDPLHLEVKIDAPKPYFLLKLTYPTAFVVDRNNVESGPNWFQQPNGTGPYKLIEWKKDQEMVYQANPNFYLGTPAIPYILVRLYTGSSVALYETGDVDLTGVPLSLVDRLLDSSDSLHAELYTNVDLCTGYVEFDVTRPPFDDIKVRQAFSMAFDRQKYIDVVLHGHALPADGLYPPGLPGFNRALTGIPFDPAEARRLLAESRYGGPGGLPPLLYTDAGFGSSANPNVAALAQMWKQYLGVDLTIENIEPNFYFEQIFSGHHGQLLGSGWCADYPDPENFADILFHTGAEQNINGYSNPDLDRLLEAARIEQNVTRRIEMYQQAEQIIVNDAPVLFTVHSLSYTLVKSYIRGFVATPIDISLERYMWIQGK